MIEIAGLLIEPEMLDNEKFQKELMELSKEELVFSLIKQAERIESLEELNQRRFNDMMMRKKSVGGITVDA